MVSESVMEWQDLKSISEASKLVLDMVISEKNTLREEFDNNFKIVMDIQDKDKDQTVQYGSMIDFLTKVPLFRIAAKLEFNTAYDSPNYAGQYALRRLGKEKRKGEKQVFEDSRVLRRRHDDHFRRIFPHAAQVRSGNNLFSFCSPSLP